MYLYFRYYITFTCNDIYKIKDNFLIESWIRLETIQDDDSLFDCYISHIYDKTYEARKFVKRTDL